MIQIKNPNQDVEPRSKMDPAPSLRTIASEEILQGESQVVIVHRGQLYRLLETRNGRLILQK